MNKEAFLAERRGGRLWSGAAVEWCGEAGIEIAGMKLRPDQSKGYIEFNISHGLSAWEEGGRTQFGGVNYYGTCMHPATVLASGQSMVHQVLNRAHEMKIYGTSVPGLGEVHRDRIFGAIVGVEAQDANGRVLASWPRTQGSTDSRPTTLPLGGREGAVRLRAVASVFKNAEGVPAFLGEHLSGRHKWTVSQEVDYSLLDSGFVVFGVKPEESSKFKVQSSKLDGGSTESRPTTEGENILQFPEGFAAAGVGYIPCVEAPEDMLDTYSPEERRVNKLWRGKSVAIMKGGLNGAVHYSGVGLVKYGAEREAEVMRLVACDPEALLREEFAEFESGLNKFSESLTNLLTSAGRCV